MKIRVLWVPPHEKLIKCGAVYDLADPRACEILFEAVSDDVTAMPDPRVKALPSERDGVHANGVRPLRDCRTSTKKVRVLWVLPSERLIKCGLVYDLPDPDSDGIKYEAVADDTPSRPDPRIATGAVEAPASANHHSLNDDEGEIVK